jgi:MFS family permease
VTFSSTEHDLENEPVALGALGTQISLSAPGDIRSHAPNLDSTSNLQRKRRQILIVLSSLALTTTGCGLNFAFGVYQELYETLDGPFKNASAGQIDLIGTLAVSLMTLGAPFASAWTKSYSPRTVTLAGGTLMAVANIAASFGQKLWHFILTQGLLLGCGTCLAYIPSVTVAPGWFDTRRGFAMGIILSGTGLGGVVWAPFLRYLNSAIGFRNTLRITGVMAFVMITASSLVLKWDPAAEARRTQESRTYRSRWNLPRANWNIVRTRAFVAHGTAAGLQAAAYITPVYFFSSFARTLGYSGTAGANFIALSNACNFAGKIVVGYLADKYGRLNALVLCTFVSALATFGFWLPSSLLLSIEARRGMFIAYTCIWGITASSYVALFPTALAEQFGIQNFASINGLLYMIRGLGTLIGTPVSLISKQYIVFHATFRISVLKLCIRDKRRLRVTSDFFSSKFDLALLLGRKRFDSRVLQVGGALITTHVTNEGIMMSYEKMVLLVGALVMTATISVSWARFEDAMQNGWKWQA